MVKLMEYIILNNLKKILYFKNNYGIILLAFLRKHIYGFKCLVPIGDI